MDGAAILQQYERIGVLGLGLTGRSCARFLLQQGIRPVLFDTRTEPPAESRQGELGDCETHLGEFKLEDLLGLDLIFLSPGIPSSLPAIKMAADAGVELMSDIELFARLVDVPVIGVTGSNGKSTVVSLCGHILQRCGRNVAVGGNIGTPVLDLLNKGHDCIVLELSSFQLELIHHLSLAAGTVLNVSADHMDRYFSETAYALTKNRIYRYAESCIFNRDDKQSIPTRKRRLQHQISFGSQASDDGFGIEQYKGEMWLCYTGQPLLAVRDLPLQGTYNQLNVQAALALVSSLGIDLEHAAQAVQSFVPLPHRCELVTDRDGICWINDSKATNPGATIAAVQGLRSQVGGQLILIAGGDAKGADLNLLSDVLDQVDTLITLGRDGHRIAALKEGSVNVANMDEAVSKAFELAEADSMVLLSPACASLDMFTNFAARGDAFRKAVEACYARV